MLSTKIDNTKAAIFNHPELGRIPAKVLLDCVFALTPAGEILHYHSEEILVEQSDQDIVLALSGGSADDSRSRCQIIPPRIPEFPTLQD